MFEFYTPDFLPILPEGILIITALAILIEGAFTSETGPKLIKRFSRGALLAITIAAILSLIAFGLDTQITTFNGMYVQDAYTLYCQLIVLLASAATLAIGIPSLETQGLDRPEYPALILLATTGMMVMISSNDLISLFIGMELQGLALYVLVALNREHLAVSEAALKYFVLGALATGMFLYGASFLYGFTGSTNFDSLNAIFRYGAEGGMSLGVVVGMVFILASLAFKMSAVPFHMWTPDVYEGAPTPIVGYLSVAGKAAGFAIILRVFSSAFGVPEWLSLNWGLVFAVLAAIGMTVGNLSALPQTNIKRMFGYSSIAQAGYLLVGVAAMGIAAPAGGLNQSTVLFFLLSYTMANLGAFIAIIAVTGKIDSDLIADFTGMRKRAPLLTLGLTLCLISLIGMPPAAGFMAKFYIFSGAVQNDLLWLVIIAVLNSVVSAFYYLRVVKVMWLGEPASDEKVPSSDALRVALSITCLGVLFIGILPGFAMKAAEFAARMFGG